MAKLRDGTPTARQKAAYDTMVQALKHRTQADAADLGAAGAAAGAAAVTVPSAADSNVLSSTSSVPSSSSSVLSSPSSSGIAIAATPVPADRASGSHGRRLRHQSPEDKFNAAALREGSLRWHAPPPAATAG